MVSRYKGSLLGVLWPFIQQLLMLIAYTVVFGYVFKSRWPGLNAEPIPLAMVIYSGLICFNLFSEIINKSANVIVNNTNYVKRVVFPLEILPLSIVISALFNYIMGILILVIAKIIFGQGIYLALFFAVPVIIPLLIFSLGLGYILSSTCIFIRDVEQITIFLTSLLLFATPIFYPATALPDSVRSMASLSPIAFAVNSVRDIVLYNATPSLVEYLSQLGLSLLVLVIGLSWFERLKRGFADVA